MKKQYTEYSKFWLGEDFDTERLDVDSTYGLLKLAGYRRAISNFVYILTGKSIPVRFAEKGTSMTDGKVVYIGGELAKGEFDPTVGIALHEAAHIIKSDFSLIKTLWGKLPREITEAANGKFNHNELGDLAKYILNVVEDRYIDAWVYATAPGYRGYYQALYDRYFNLPEIGHGLKSQDYRESTFKNYKFRFTNITNKHTDLDALPALRKISEMLDLPNILREEMESPKDRLELALKITEEIVKSAVENGDKQKQNCKSDEIDESSSDEKNEDDFENADSFDTNDGLDKIDRSGGDSEENQDSDNSQDYRDKISDLSEKKKKKIDRLIEKQEALVNRTNAKSPFDSKTLGKLQALEKSGVNIVSVGKEEGVPVVDCIVVTNLTKELMSAGDFPYVSKYGLFSENSASSRGVREGIVLGKMLGRRLQIRSEVKITKFSRLDNGKIDRRLLSTLGYDNKDLFYQTMVDKYKNIHLHISVDASSSMVNKWEKTMTALVAIAKAASMTNNVSVSISFRSGMFIGKGRAAESPYIVIAYDSRKDKFNKIMQFFPMLHPNGSTPEGLAFQAIMSKIPPSTHELDSYFVNLSDGEPAFNLSSCYTNYVGEIGSRHTRKQVNKMLENGVEVISYYIENTEVRAEANMRNFKTMYGKDAQFIDIQNVIQIAHTLNKKFLSKENT
jgi:hypothetical protein